MDRRNTWFHSFHVPHGILTRTKIYLYVFSVKAELIELLFLKRDGGGGNLRDNFFISDSLRTCSSPAGLLKLDK